MEEWLGEMHCSYMSLMHPEVYFMDHLWDDVENYVSRRHLLNLTQLNTFAQGEFDKIPVGRCISLLIYTWIKIKKSKVSSVFNIVRCHQLYCISAYARGGGIGALRLTECCQHICPWLCVLCILLFGCVNIATRIKSIVATKTTERALILKMTMCSIQFIWKSG